MGTVVREDRGGTVVLTLDRPERRNALSAATVAALIAALNEAAPAARAIVITGRGPVFCAGGDLADGLGGDSFLEGHAARGRFAELLATIPKLRVPVIAAVNGDALGGGLGLALACDLVVADPRASFGTPEIKLGLFPMVILAVLQRDVPRKVLAELVLTGGKLDAARALAHGMITRVSAPGAALDEAVALAEAVGARSPATIALGKAAFHRVSDLAYDDALAYLHTQLTLNLLTEDAAEGVAAFLERREPRWKGR